MSRRILQIHKIIDRKTYVRGGVGGNSPMTFSPPLLGSEYRSVTFLILARNMGFAQILARKLVFLLNFSPDIGFFNDFSFARKFGFCLDFRVRFKYYGRSWGPFF